MSHTNLPALAYPVSDIDMICARKNALTERIRSVDPIAMLDAPDLPIYWAALRLAATRRDIYDAMAHVRCLHEPVSLRLDWLDQVVDVDPLVVEALEPGIETAIAARRHHDVFVAWAHACHDDEAWEVLRNARLTLAGRTS